MTKKSITIIIVIAIVYIFVCGMGYWYFSRRMDDIDRRGFSEEALEYLSSNEQFLQEYGEIIYFESDDERPIPSEDNEDEYYMDFKCHTENAEMLIRVYHVWNDGWSFYYVIQGE